MIGSISRDDDITSYSEVNWVPPNWKKEELLKVIYDLKKMSIAIFPFRFEWIFSRHFLPGKLIAKIAGQKYRHKLYMKVYHVRKRIWNWLFVLRYGSELKRQIIMEISNETNIEEERRRQNRLKEYERQIMEKSDELKKKAIEEQIMTMEKNEKLLNLVLNDCEKIATYKKKFSD